MTPFAWKWWCASPLCDDWGIVSVRVELEVDRGSESDFAGRALLGRLPAAVYACEASGRITYYNAEAVRLWGRAPDLGDLDARFCGAFRLWRPDGTRLRHEDTPMAVALRTGEGFRNESVIIERPDGTQIWIRVNIDAICDDEGRIVGAVNVFFDNTTSKHAEDELRRSNSQLSAFMETALIGLHRVGADGTILWANDAELRMLGYAREEYIGHNIAEFHVDTALIADILARLKRGEKLREYEARLRCKDGSIRVVQIDSSVFSDADRFIHTQCFTRDVTERRRMEEAQARLAAIVSSSDDAIISNTLEGIITSWNHAAEKMYGYSATEAVGRSIGIIVPEHLRGEQDETIARLARGERVEHLETQRRANDGRLIDVSLTISPLRNRRGRIVGASKIARDITDRKRAEASLRDADRRKDEFLATLSHELRNPLAPIRTAVDLLRTAGEDSPIVTRAHGILARQVGHLTTLVDDLLELSRVNTGTIVLRKRIVKLDEVILSAVETCGAAMQAAGHHFEVVRSKQAIELLIDPVRVTQSLANLLANAAKYTPDGGRIELSVHSEAAVAVIAVRDSGIGLEPEMLSRVFELFWQENTRNRATQSGLGVGLWLARHLIELHGGSIEARSEGRGKGSEFVMRLPAAVTARGEDAMRSERASSGLSRRILVVDDNVDAAESLGLLLETMGHDVQVVHSGREGLEAAKTSSPEIVLLDISLPDIDGYAVAAALRSDPGTQGTTIVAVTGHGQLADREQSRDAGFDAHLLKPVSLDKLTAVLEPASGHVSKRP
jgi:PAS domain S-box-containing protein